jgi:hypothetical protein
VLEPPLAGPLPPVPPEGLAPVLDSPASEALAGSRTRDGELSVQDCWSTSETNIAAPRISILFRRITSYHHLGWQSHASQLLLL